MRGLVNKLLGFPLPLALSLTPGYAVSAEAAQGSVRQFVEAACGPQLAAFEALLRKGESVWQQPGAMSARQEDIAPARMRIGAWLSSAYPLIDSMITASAAAKVPEHRNAAADRLEAALSVTNCLTPAQDHWAQTDKTERQSLDQEAQSLQCVVASSRNLYAALSGELEGEALIHEAEAQMQAAQTQCKSED